MRQRDILGQCAGADETMPPELSVLNEVQLVTAIFIVLWLVFGGRRRRLGIPPPAVVAAALAGLCLGSDASAASKPKLPPPTGTPVLAVVAIKEQRITIYGTDGKMMQAPVSTGQRGYETPAGVFSILEKQREHYSNLYDDASMPFMQRLTWSGIALHAGALPGRPASHGCIRMPHSFAGQLFDVTRAGMRVVVAPADISPIEISHPLLFRPGLIVSEPRLQSIMARSGANQDATGAAPIDAVSARTWRAVAAENAAKAEAAIKAVTETKMEAAKLSSERRLAEKALRSAEFRLKTAERSLEWARSERLTERAEKDNAKALELLTESRRRLDAAKAEAQLKIDAEEAGRAAADTANVAMVTAQEAAKLAEKKLAPVTVFVSRKTQRLYVRQAFQPILDAPVTIRDPDKPIGTTIFTAAHYVNDSADLRWTALSMSKPDPAPRRTKRAEAVTDTQAAKAVLERISIPVDLVERINEVASPGASLIISDEAMHPRETGKATDFIVVMSELPQGGLTIRPRGPNRDRAFHRDRASHRDRESPYRRSPSGNPFFWW
jgi:hypothetical protein